MTKENDERLEKFLKSLPITPCLKKCETIFCSACIEKNRKVAQYCPHVAKEFYKVAPTPKEAPARTPEREELVKLEPVPLPTSAKPKETIRKRKERREPAVIVPE